MTAADVIAGRARHSCESGPNLPWLLDLPEASVNCTVTSPPYYGQRDYGTSSWEGGDPACAHRSPTMRAGRNESRPMLAGSAASNARQLIVAARAGVCGKCGAIRTDHQIGLEETPDLFIARLVEVFEAVRRATTADGTLWVNIGDSYANDASASNDPGPRLQGRANVKPPQKGWRGAGLKKKDRIGIPHMLAFALRAAGWWWRDEIIWHKPNPMTKSVKDRTTDAHEFLFLFTKSPRYFWDFDAVQERAAYAGRPQLVRAKQLAADAGLTAAHIAAVRACGLTDTDRGRATSTGAGRNNQDVQRLAAEAKEVLGGYYREFLLAETRNPRSVWKIAPERRKAGGKKHYAVMPLELARRAIVAGCPTDGVVMDPFAGSGTTLAAAVELNRRAVGVDLNPEYAELARRRVAAVTPNLLGA